jgi:hypothetical protein
MGSFSAIKVVAPLFNGAADIGQYSNAIVTLDLAPLQGVPPAVGRFPV